MTTTAAEVEAMRLAIALSAQGLSSASPNPPVGCVVLDSAGQVVGRGYHCRKGEPHAEANALTDAGPRARGGTAVVTLEPCNHHGRTPPCHQALIDAGIRRVLIAIPDPTSRGIGGIARLRHEGLDVEVGLLADEAHYILGRWLHATHTHQTHLDQQAGPVDSRLLANYDVVITADGAVAEAVPGAHGDNSNSQPTSTWTTRNLPSVRSTTPVFAPQS
jgi:diaminohydroxyphosphoribosylaminopyrimidine deaminase / 5-amino-6-(5-phosphoribosylamino)uracil reductase